MNKAKSEDERHGYKTLTINTMQTMGEGSYTFIGEMHGYRLIFEQWDNGPVELDKEALAADIGHGVKMLPLKFFDFIIRLALPEIAKIKYHSSIFSSFSEN